MSDLKFIADDYDRLMDRVQNGTPVECTSPEGETIAFIDAAHLLMRQIADRLSNINEVHDALKDMFSDDKVARVIFYAVSRGYLHDAPLTQGLLSINSNASRRP